MKSKGTLFVGIAMLVIGIFLRKVLYFDLLGLILILTGVLMKTIYIISKARSGEYNPGSELFYLIIGLIIFLTGIYLRSIQYNSVNPIFFIGLGLTLKVIFIVLFIRKVRLHREGLIE